MFDKATLEWGKKHGFGEMSFVEYCRAVAKFTPEQIAEWRRLAEQFAKDLKPDTIIGRKEIT